MIIFYQLLFKIKKRKKRKEIEMNNLTIFFANVTLFFLIWFFVITPEKFQSLAYYIKGLAIVALLCMPLNINGTVITVLGSAQAKNVISVFSVHQDAEDKAFALVGSGYQRAGKSATTLFGFSVYQMADKTNMLAGASFCQKSKSGATVWVGFSGHQEASEGSATTFIGFSGFQKASKDANMFAGVSLCQKAKQSVFLAIGFSVFQKGRTEAGILAGLVLYQEAGTMASSTLAIAVIQKNECKTRYFAAFSPLTQ